MSRRTFCCCCNCCCWFYFSCFDCLAQNLLFKSVDKNRHKHTQTQLFSFFQFNWHSWLIRHTQAQNNQASLLGGRRLAAAVAVDNLSVFLFLSAVLHFSRFSTRHFPQHVQIQIQIQMLFFVFCQARELKALPPLTKLASLALFAFTANQAQCSVCLVRAFHNLKIVHTHQQHLQSRLRREERQLLLMPMLEQ